MATDIPNRRNKLPSNSALKELGQGCPGHFQVDVGTYTDKALSLEVSWII